jgi:hypothetical protein
MMNQIEQPDYVTGNMVADVLAIKTLLKTQTDLLKKVNKMKKGFVELHCPVKVGDIVTVNDFAYKGKQMKITQIFYAPAITDGKKTFFKCKGRVIKLDGKVSKSLTARCYL